MAAQTHHPKRVAVAIELQWNVPWHLECFQGIADYGKEQGWACVIDPYLSGPTGDGGLSSYDGVVGRLNEEHSERISSAALPGVNLLTTGVDHGLHSVRCDAPVGAKLAGEHLIASGYRRFGHVRLTPHIQSYTDPIIKAFENVLASHGYPPSVSIEINNDALEQAESSKACLRAMTEWVQSLEKPVGLYVYLIDFARYLTQICGQVGLRIPEDVGIVVQDADQTSSTLVTPTLSAIDFDFWEQGYQAAAVLDRLMRGEPVEPRNRLIAPKRVVVRESSDAFVYDDALVSEAMRLIASQSRRPISAEDIAGPLGVSRRTLDRRFEEVLKTTVNHAITQRRIEGVKAVLIESDLTMVAITELFEFGSASQFTQYFKKHAGMTPTAYRDTHKAKASRGAHD